MSSDNVSVSPLEFSLTQERVPVNLLKKDGSIWECYLEEMDGEDRDKYLQAQRAKTDGKSQVRDYKDLHTLLIGFCLYDKLTEKRVDKEDIRAFPAKVQNDLFEKCVELNALGPKKEEELKNE